MFLNLIPISRTSNSRSIANVHLNAVTAKLTTTTTTLHSEARSSPRRKCASRLTELVMFPRRDPRWFLTTPSLNCRCYHHCHHCGVGNRHSSHSFVLGTSSTNPSSYWLLCPLECVNSLSEGPFSAADLAEFHSTVISVTITALPCFTCCLKSPLMA